MWPRPGKIEQLHDFEKEAADSFVNRRFFVAKLRSERNIFFDRSPRHQRGILKHHGDNRLGVSLADEFDRSRRLFFQSRDDMKQRRFAATGGSDDAEEFAVANL